MWKPLLFLCLLLVTVWCDHHVGHGDGDHDHGEQNHTDHDHGSHNHADHSHNHADHSHGAHNQEDHDHGTHNDTDHDHGSHHHHHHDHGTHHHHHDHGHHHHHGHEDSNAERVRDCAEHLNAGHRESGIYRIQPQGCHHAIDVLCDMDTDGGGWTVIQKRGEYGNDADYFYKTWNEYKEGFGVLEKEFWIGNYHINHLTEQGHYELRIDMWDLQDNHLHVQYGNFKTGNETHNYDLAISEFSGDTGDSMSSLNGASFSTHDRDNDGYEGSCAEQSKGAWWYKDCGSSNLNGPHLSDPSGDITQSIFWFGQDNNPILLKKTIMMVRPKARL